MKTVKQYLKHYYRQDTDGTPIKDFYYVYDISEDQLKKEIIDVSAIEYGVVEYIKEYSFNQNIEIPANIVNVEKYVKEQI